MDFEWDAGLWAPQLRSVEGVIDAWQDTNRLLLFSPTGSGKTRMCGEIFRWANHHGKRAIFYANRKLLIGQTDDRFRDLGLDVGIRAAEYDSRFDDSCDVQIASADTERARVFKGGKWDFYDVGDGGIVAVDEAHLQKTKVMKDILQWYEKRGAKILLLTATPVAMSGWADKLLVGGKLSEWRGCGALVPVYTYNISQPDMRKVKRNNTGEFVMDDGMKMQYLQTIVGEVIENWELLNDGSPTMCYAPGVPESIWLAEKFRARGHEFVHVDATDAYIGGKRVKMNQQVWSDIVSGVKSGDIRGLSSRFKLREGVDIPAAGHCVLATPVGSLASYLQILGRVMRSAKGKVGAILQDHGGCYHLHGSPNLDRPWESLWRCSESAASNYHQDLIREDQIKEPIRCPACGMERTGGPKCPGCGHEATKGKRAIRMESGELSEIIEGPMIKPRRRILKSTTAEDWAKMFWGFKRKKVDRSFSQMEAYFLQEYGYRPPRNLPYMPKHFLDWKAKVHEVDMKDLIHRKDTDPKGVSRKIGSTKGAK